MRSKVRTYGTKIFLITLKAMTGWYDFSNVKSSEMLSFYSVAEAHGLIYPRPSGENFSFAWIRHSHEQDFLRSTWTFCLRAVSVPHFLQWSSSLPILPSSCTRLEMKTHARNMNLPLQSGARWKHSTECFTEYQTRYIWPKPSNVIGSWVHK